MSEKMSASTPITDRVAAAAAVQLEVTSRVAQLRKGNIAAIDACKQERFFERAQRMALVHIRLVHRDVGACEGWFVERAVPGDIGRFGRAACREPRCQDHRRLRYSLHKRMLEHGTRRGLY